MTLCKILFVTGALFACTAPGYAQNPDSGTSGTSDKAPSEHWNLFYQATSIGDYHGAFTAPYTGPLSLQDSPERDVSLTTTLFFTARIEQNTFLVFNPEIAGGKGFSGVEGFGNPPNGEIPRVASAMPKPYIARLYIQHDFRWAASGTVRRAMRISSRVSGLSNAIRYTQGDSPSRIFSTTTTTRTIRELSSWHGA